jgi:phosphatidylglycerol:prolipoprotein diacylglycerol transferase
VHPELLRIGSFVLPTYGLLLAAGFFAALFLLRKRASQLGLPAETVADLGIWILLAGLVGSKALLVIVEWPHYVTSGKALLELLRSAGVFYGGLIGATAAALFLIRKKGIPFWTLADAASPCIALGQSIGRLGCFSAGCCWGRETHVPWAITFTDPAAERNVGVPLGVPLHPTQLYESLGTALLCVALIALEKRTRGPRFAGETFARYLIGYAVLRGVIETFRGDPRGTVFGAALSTSQFIAILGVLAGVAIWLARRHQPRPATA